MILVSYLRFSTAMDQILDLFSRNSSINIKTGSKSVVHEIRKMRYENAAIVIIVAVGITVTMLLAVAGLSLTNCQCSRHWNQPKYLHAYSYSEWPQLQP